MGLRALLPVLREGDPYRALRESVTGASPGGGLEARISSSLRPAILAALLDDPEALGGRPGLIVAADDRAARELAGDLAAFLEPRRVRAYPSRGTGYESHISPPPHLVGLRIAAMDALRAGVEDGEPAIVVANAIALTERVPDAGLRPEGFAVHAGEEVDLSDLAELLSIAGYERVEQVDDRGQFAIRGGICDVFAATADRAARIELFGDEVESIREFSTFTQRSMGELERLEVSPAAEMDPEHADLAALAADDEVDLADVLPLDRFVAPLEGVGAETAILVADGDDVPAALADHASDVEASIDPADAEHLYVSGAEAPQRALLTLRRATDEEAEHVIRAAPPVSVARNLAEGEAELERHVRSGYAVGLTFERRGEAERIQYRLERTEAPFLDRAPFAGPGVRLAEARIAEGFLAPSLGVAVIPYAKLVHRRAPDVVAPARARLASFADLRVGDYVVHEDQGIAHFAGFDTREVGGVVRDYLTLEFRDEARILLPADQLGRLTRYLGADASPPQLSELGGKRWAAAKSRARRAAQELAGDLLNLYAERRARRGHAFEPDGEWDLALERDFPHRETADQLGAIEAVKADMESERPMDRLICGDVGYGKTEIAIRAACKAAVQGKQVMVLAPTTLLANQHLGTFAERLRDIPIEVEMISRLRTTAEVNQALKAFAEGRIDVLVGTHRLLSRDVRAKDLGLLVIDEEQRFGVKQKELLRQLKLRVDVIAMSATPIPRTLQMSLAGLRDISVITTPPEGRRPVRTHVGPYDERLVVRAIEREIERDGQVFFLHNRVETIDDAAEALRAVTAGARVIVAHGQMKETELERSMMSFVRGDADVLVATTIIEAGLDIPQANTLIVERADMLGLSQAYQIRGRVGRSAERAHAYLFYPSDAALSAEAKGRLAALADHTELGAGFRIAMRDLELRGAGNLLGDEQSGHVAAVGFELYCELLDDAVRAMESGDARPAAEMQVRLDLDVDAYVPPEYVPYEAAKVDVHRRIASARDADELSELRFELRDRFGPEPEPVAALLELQRIRNVLSEENATALEGRGAKVSIAPIELDSARVKALRELLEGVIYESRARTLSLRVEDEAGAGAARLAAASALADALVATKTVRGQA